MKIKLFEEFHSLNEGRVELPKIISDKTLGLVSYEGTYVLFNVKNGSGIGYIQLDSTGGVINVASKRGYGQSLYDIAIQEYSKGIHQDSQGSTSKEAQKVWDSLWSREDLEVDKSSENSREWLVTSKEKLNLKPLKRRGQDYEEENFISIIELIDDIDGMYNKK